MVPLRSLKGQEGTEERASGRSRRAVRHRPFRDRRCSAPAGVAIYSRALLVRWLYTSEDAAAGHGDGTVGVFKRRAETWRALASFTRIAKHRANCPLEADKKQFLITQDLQPFRVETQQRRRMTHIQFSADDSVVWFVVID